VSSPCEPCGRCAACQSRCAISSHPFVEDDKGTAFAPIIAFLGLDGIDFDVPPAAATAMILALATGEIDGLARWTEDNISPPSGR